MRKLVPLILGLIGLGAGVGAGVALRPAPEAAAAAGAAADACAGVGAPEQATRVLTAPAELDFDYVKINNQFVIPRVLDGRIKALVVMTLSLEIAKGRSEQVFAREPKLRDALLRVMFDHANSGGFDGEFTSNGNLAQLRVALKNAAVAVLGSGVNDVLIVDIARQDN